MYTVGWNPASAPGIETLLDDPDPWVRGLAYFVRGQIANNFGRTGQTAHDFDHALAAFRESGDRWGLSVTLTSQAEILGRRGDHRGAVDLYEEALRLNAELGGGTAGLLHVHMRLANGLDLIGERDRAEALLHAALRDSVSTNAEETAALHYQLGEFARRSGDTAEALRRLSRADELTADLPGPAQFRAMILCARAQLDLAMGALDAATARLDEALRGAVQAQDYPIVSHVLAGHAERARVLGDPTRAAELLGTADALRGSRDLSLPDVVAIETATRIDLSEEAFTTAYNQGRTKTFKDVLTTFALPLDPSKPPPTTEPRADHSRRQHPPRPPGSPHAGRDRSPRSAPPLDSRKPTSIPSRRGGSSRTGLLACATPHAPIRVRRPGPSWSGARAVPRTGAATTGRHAEGAPAPGAGLPAEPGDRSDTPRTRTVTTHQNRGVRIDRLVTGVPGGRPPGPTQPGS
jgi:tetratricopeptide (TPR) repeat protein